MLRSLHIRNYVLIDSLDIEFPDGLVILTGRTGAGKSLLLGAIGLLGGGRADASLIGGGAGSCVVEAEFDTPEGLRIIRRVLYASGRSRCFIDDCPASLPELSELCSRLIDIHSQHQSLLLTDRQYQLSVIDRYASDGTLLEDCSRSWKELCALKAEKEELAERLRRSVAEKEYNEAQYRELSAAGLKEDELQELEEEQKALANAGEIRERLSRAAAAFAPPGQTEIVESLTEARRQLEHAASFIPRLAELAGRVESARLELDDVYSELSSEAEKTDNPEVRLAEVDERLSLLYRLLRKHGVREVSELIAIRDKFGESVSDAESLDGRLEELDARIAKAEAAHEKLCADLHEARSAASARLAGEITASLHYLELEKASFKAELSKAEPGATGADAAVFLFSASGGRGVELGKCASGGELSRIMLGLKAALARFEGMPTLVFDEIDTGVSGSVADKMGSMICRMGDTSQVIAITHLPQVAAKGKAHFVVTKESGEGRDATGIRRVEGEERVGEIARLLSGAEVTKEAIANARTLING
ncbi:MAG: DNA repair protein RecN [Bacteroidales bacterium]|nr:DNA repair protein RecN [Bacteroidales bacterium]